MKRLVTILLLFSLCTVALFCQQDKSAQADAQIEQIKSGLITYTIQDRMAELGVPGLSIAVIHNFQIDWAKAYGVLDSETQEPVTERTLFQAASISKPVACMGALKLAQEGKLDITKNVNEFLSSWKLPENDHTDGNPVTLSHLMSHSGGTTVHGFPGYKPSKPLPTVPQILDGEDPANTKAVRVDLDPGTKFRYSGGGTTIMQQLVMDVTGIGFPEYMREAVLVPAGMEYSTYQQPLPESLLKFAAAGHMRNGDPIIEKRHTYPEMAAAGLWTTPTDLANLAIEVQKSLKGESNKILNQEFVTKMVTAFADTVYGLGFSINREGYFSHGGSNAGFRCILMAHKEDGYGAVIMTNGSNSAIYNEILRAIARAYDWENF